MTIRRFTGLSLVAAAAAAAPFTFDANDRVFRLQEACGQATECEAATNYVCSTANQDHIGYKCSKGCGRGTT